MDQGPITAAAQPVGTGTARKFNRSVHGARGLFSAMVFIFHVVNSGLATLSVLAGTAGLFVTRSTEYGVELFFGISGYVIVGTLARAKTPAAFLEDRAIRIFPVLWASILAIVAIGLVTRVRAFEHLDPKTLVWALPANLLALPGIVPIDPLHPAAWSLSYELCFYAICAALWAMRRARAPAGTVAVATAGMALLAFYPRALFLMAGVLVATGIADHPRLAPLRKHPALWLLVFLAAWHGIQLLSWPRHIIATTLFEWAADWRLPLAALGFAAATLAFGGIAEGRGALGSMLRTAPMQYLGTISYSFYLWHPVIMSGTKMAMYRTGAAGAAGAGAQALFLLLSLPPSLLAAHVSQRVLERGASLWLRRRLHHPVSLALSAEAGSGAGSGSGSGRAVPGN